MAEMVAMAKDQGLELTGPDGLLKLFIKSVLETALNEELTEHLGHDKYRADSGRDSAKCAQRFPGEACDLRFGRCGRDLGSAGS